MGKSKRSIEDCLKDPVFKQRATDLEENKTVTECYQCRRIWFYDHWISRECLPMLQRAYEAFAFRESYCCENHKYKPGGKNRI